MSGVSNNNNRYRIPAVNSKGNHGQQQQRDQNQGQGNQNNESGNGNDNSSDVHSKVAAKWSGGEAAPSTPMSIRGNVGGTEKGKATVNINHKASDGNAKQIDTFQTTINPGGVVLDSWTVRGVKPEGSVSFEIKTENGKTYQGNEFRLKAPIKG